MNDTTTNQHVVVRRYAYFTEEYISFAVAGLFGGGFVYLLGLPFTLPLSLLVAALSIAGGIYLSWSRKERSKVTVTVGESRYFQVHSEGRVGEGSVDLTKVHSVTFREVGANECFILREPANSKGDVAHVNVPTRVLDDATLYKIVGDQIEQSKAGRLVREAYSDLTTPPTA